MRKKQHIAKKSKTFTYSEGSLSTLGEALVQQHPELAQKMGEIRSSDQVMSRLARVVHDLLPFSWVDSVSFDEGVRLSSQGKPVEAMEALEKALRRNPDAYPAYHLLGYVFGTLGNLKEEMENYKKALKLNPHYCQLHLDLGRVFWRRGKAKRANFAFKQAAMLDPGYGTCSDWLELTFDMLGRYPENLDVGDQRLRDKRRVLAQTYYMLGTAYVEYGMHPSARYAFKDSIQVKPDFPEAYYNLGVLHIKKLRNPKRAAKYLKQAEKLFIEKKDIQGTSLARLVLRPEVPGINKEKLAEDWIREGLRLQQLGVYQGAADACKEAIYWKPDLIDAHYNLGIAYGSLHDAGAPRIDRAINAFRETLKINADYKHAYIALGASYLKQNDFEGAIEILEEGIRIDPDNPVIFYYLGLAFQGDSQFQLAADSLQMAISLKPDLLEAHYFLGMVNFDTMHFEEAVKRFEKTVRLKPDFADGHYMLGILHGSKFPDPEKATIHLKKAEKLYLKQDDHVLAVRAKQMLDSQALEEV